MIGWRHGLRCLLMGVTCAFTGGASLVHAQTPGGDVQDVFIDRSADASQPDTIYFVSARTGLSSIYPINGKQESLLNSGILYRDQASEALMLLTPDGTTAPIGYMAAPPVKITGWAISRNGGWIAWVEVHTQAVSLLSDLVIARADGSQKIIAVHTSSAAGVTILPIAVSDEGSTIAYSRQAAETRVPIYLNAADVSVWQSGTAAPLHLPSEPLCSCAASATADGKTVIRLDNRLAAHLIDRASGAALTIAPPANLAAGVAGDLLVQPGGNLIAYSVATSIDARIARYGLVVIDTTRQIQTILIAPGTIRYQPIAFTADSLLLSAVNRNGTYRLPLTGGTPVVIATDSYLGTLGGTP